MPPIQLPTTQREIARRDPRFLILYGKPKVGKTTKLSQLPDNLIIDIERGTDFIPALCVQANDYSELTQIWNALAEKKKAAGGVSPYKYLTIDSATKLEDWAEEVATVEYKKLPIAKTQQDLKSVLELPQGAGYGYLRSTFMRIVRKFMAVTDTLILVGHVTASQIDKDGNKTNSKDLDLIGRLKRIAGSEADAVGYLYRDFAGRLMVSFQTSEVDGVMGSRAGHLIDKNIELEWKDIFLDDKTLNP